MNHDAQHFASIEQYALSIQQRYLQALRDIMRLLSRTKIDISKPFRFEDYPEIKHLADKLFSSLSDDVKISIENGISKEWLSGNMKSDDIADHFLEGSRLSESQKKIYYNRNKAGLAAFRKRKANGLGLSDMVWLYSNQFKDEIEMAIDTAILDKVPAAELSRTVRQYLQKPDRLFRRVRDSRGVLHLSKAAKAYNPGRGVYRSSYKNAMRLARTEINMAYRTADHDRMNELPFILGFEVKLSNNHPVADICDRLKGKYPKEFIFKGWHPQCRCHVISIIMDDEEYNLLENKLLAGEDISDYKSKNAVKDVPDGFKKWVSENRERAKKWKSQPYFMKDNPGFIS